ncbi:MAG TPA: pitrilysin family protein [Candidatus Paceibacterota bacterium]|jgi:predicted Zn-dependent peptidase|nr:pitrilysin family protein [Candidatus Paceibacterota bacterium]
MKPPKKITLKNGLRIILAPQPGGVAASVLILVAAGSEYETKATNGLSHFLEHMTFKGTTDRPRPGMIAEELAALGAQSNAFTSEEFTGYWAKVEAGKIHNIVEIVSDLYLHPLFAPEEIEKERGVIIEELNMYEDMPMRKVQDVFGELLYGDQPAGWDVGGTKANIKKLKRDQFVAYRNARYVAPGTVVAIGGAFNERKIIAQIKEAFGGLARRSAYAKPKTHERQARPAVKLKFKESDQGHLVLGFRAFDLFDERRYALQVLASVLGGGMSSRLWKRVREEMGAAYYVGADTDLSLDHGAFSVSAGVERSKMELVIATILEECRKIAEEPVPAAELRRVKDHMIGGLVLGLETSDELASFYGTQEVLTKRLLPPEAIISRINGIRAEEVRAVAKAIFKNKGLNLAVIGPYKDAASFRKILTL